MSTHNICFPQEIRKIYFYLKKAPYQELCFTYMAGCLLLIYQFQIKCVMPSHSFHSFHEIIQNYGTFSGCLSQCFTDQLFCLFVGVMISQVTVLQM